MLTPLPLSTATLLQKAQSLSGQTLKDLACIANTNVPERLLHHKGWVGQLLEWHLGAQAGNRSLPDFIELGIELKTLPLQASGKPKESTYVCTATLQANAATPIWHNSPVYQKLAKVLWIPLEADPNIPIAERRILSPFLWMMPPHIEVILKNDWEELMEILHLGRANALSARYGTYLHIRPKAAHSRIKSEYLSLDGQMTDVVPKGFYLRPAFTQYLLETESQHEKALQTE